MRFGCLGTPLEAKYTSKGVNFIPCSRPPTSLPLARKDMAHTAKREDKGGAAGPVGVATTTTRPLTEAAEVDGAAVGPAPEKLR